eukprot:223880_1
MSNEATRTMDKCIVYWDYENQPIPKAGSLSTIVPILKNKLCSSIGKKLPIEFKVYVQASQITHELQNAFDINGMMQIHVPSTKPESVDKRMIFDITFSLYELERDNKSRPIAIISADKDFGHLLSNIHNTSPISHQFLILLHDNSIDPNLSNAVDGIIQLSQQLYIKNEKTQKLTAKNNKIPIKFEHLNSDHETFVLEIKIKKNNIVSNIRDMVQRRNIRFNLPKKALVLLFNGNTLNDNTKVTNIGLFQNDTIMWYYDMNIIHDQNDDRKIKNNSLDVKKSNLITIHLQEPFNKKIFTIRVDPTQISIQGIKNHIRKHAGYRTSKAITLEFKGKTLLNKYMMDHYDICDGDNLIWQIKRKKICIKLEQLSSGNITNIFEIKYENCRQIVALRQVICNNNMHLKRSTDEFYLFYKPFKYTNNIFVNNKTNEFMYNNNCQYAARFCQYFYDGQLKREDPDPQYHNISTREIKNIINLRFPQLKRTLPIHQKAFWEYLYTQFQQVVASTLIRNEWYNDAAANYGGHNNNNQQQFTEWKHLVTESIIDLAEDFSKKLYEIKDDEKYNGDESSGKETFHLCTKWQQKSKPIVLLNQSGDGSISFLINDMNQVDDELKNGLKVQQFDILEWKQQNIEKEKKIQLLLKILGTSNSP